jgi:hypothetical protein
VPVNVALPGPTRRREDQNRRWVRRAAARPGGLPIANQHAIFTAPLAEHAEQDVRDAGYFDQAVCSSCTAPLGAAPPKTWTPCPRRTGVR